MIPVRLTIEGLYSYQKKQTIDFTRLTAANIFGIFGQVGSGKSSILEAISYAIYGDTERLNSKEGRGYNMMNLKSDSLLVEFEFVSGINHKSYLVIVSARRNSKRFEDVKTIERKAFVDDAGSWIPVELSSLEEAIGLSYANFKRTIIIPQGRFQEFLQLDKKERTNMMKELFNLEKYDLFWRAASLDKRNNDKRQFLEGQLSSLGDVSAEQIEQLKELLSQYQDLAQSLSVELEQKRKELEEWKRLKELDIKKGKLLADRKELDEKTAAISRLNDKLKEYEYCLVHFKGLMEQEQQAQKSINLLNEALRIEKQSLKKTLDELADKQQQQVTLKEDYDQRDRLNAEADDLDRIAKAKVLIAEIESLISRAAKGEEVIKANEAKVKELKDVQEKQTSNLKNLKQQLPDVALLSRVREWYTYNKSLSAQHVEAKQEHESALKEKQSAEGELVLLLDGKELTVGLPVTSPSQAQEKIREEVVRLTDIVRQKDKELQHLLVQQKLGQYADELQSGEPCPLCGSTHHPQILNIANVAEAISTTRRQKENTQASIDQCNVLDRKLVELGAKLKGVNEKCGRATERVAKLEADLKQHQDKFEWETYKTEESLSKAFAAADKLGKDIKVLEDAIEKASSNLQEEEKNTEKYRKAVEAFKLEMASKEGQKQSLIAGLRHLQLSQHEGKAPKELEDMAIAKRNHVSSVVAKFDRLSTEIADLRQQEGKSSGSIAANVANLHKEQQSLDSIIQSISQKLEANGHLSLEEVKQTLALGLDVDGVRKQIADHNQAVQTVAAQIIENEKEFAGRTYNAEEHLALDGAVVELANREGANRKDIGSVENEIATKNATLEQQAAIRKELDVVTVRASELSTLKNMLQGNKFIDFISTTYLQNLCSAANDRFYKMTRQRLSLELTEDNSFQVRDFMNGGKTRSVKTLSGGQTFQASLSLALALSDNIQRMQSADQNFFFLDEGFGTLDKDSLGIVFDTLKSLRKENRIVGVISHVDEMQQEIETYLKVVNHDDGGSIVTASWE
jgi:DNA repair protein SbcC/Rad50